MNQSSNSKIALISNSLSSTFIFRKTLIEKLKTRDQLACVVTTWADFKNISEKDKKTPIEVISGNSILEKIKATIKVGKILKEKNTKFCHGFTHAGNLTAFMLSVIANTELIYNVTGMGRAFSTTTPKTLLQRMLILGFYFATQFKIKALIVQNLDDKKLFKSLFTRSNQKKIKNTNGSGIDPNHFEEVTPHPELNKNSHMKIGFFSRALPEKGVGEYYNLAKEYRGTEIDFFHIGHPGNNEYAPDRIADTASASNINYIGFQIDPRPWIVGLDVIVIPSAYREGLSRLFIEAAVAGKTIVARTTSGVRDYKEQLPNLLLYENSDELVKTFHEALKMSKEIGTKDKEKAISLFSDKRIDEVYFECYK